MTCIKCETLLRDEAKFCDACGMPQQEEKPVCQQCDTELVEGALFCHVCGLKYGKYEEDEEYESCGCASDVCMDWQDIVTEKVMDLVDWITEPLDNFTDFLDNLVWGD